MFKRVGAIEKILKVFGIDKEIKKEAGKLCPKCNAPMTLKKENENWILICVKCGYKE